MAKEPKYHEFYGELISSNVFLKRMVVLLVLVNIGLAALSYFAYTRPGDTFVVKDGYAYAAESRPDQRSEFEVKRFTSEFAKHFLEYNRENFNQRFKAALKMCSVELEYFMHNAVRESEIPKIVQNTPGTIRFEVEEIQVRRQDNFVAQVRGQQLFPDKSRIPIKFVVDIITVPRSEDNPFGLRIINYTQEQS